MIEKPTPTEAEQRLIVPGLRAGHYLCFFGMHVLTPAVMELLGEQAARRPTARPLSPRSPSWRGASTTWRWKSNGRRYDIGATLRPADARNWRWPSAGSDRDEVLAQLVELLADRELRAAAGGLADEPAHRRSSPRPTRRRAQPLARTPSAATLPLDALLAECAALDRFRRPSDNLYERVRALFFLYAIHRFHLPLQAGPPARRR